MSDLAVSTLSGALTHLVTTLELVLMRTTILSELVGDGNHHFIVTAVDELEEAHDANAQAGLRAVVVAAEVAFSLGLPVVSSLAAVAEAADTHRAADLTQQLRELRRLCTQIDQHRTDGLARAVHSIDKIGEMKARVGAGAGLGYDRSGRSVG